MTEGPYFTPGSPERKNLLETGVPGEKLTLTGWVLTPDCQPVSGALLDFWQADGEGRYDNAGYVLRGHQLTDENGRFELITVVPGEYPGRTEHIHVKVQAPGGPILTTQIFFPGVSANESDRIFDESLLVTVLGQGDGMQAQYNFVVIPQ
jgi:protocatechuate 3,4-dioxygenase beta subunit